MGFAVEQISIAPTPALTDTCNNNLSKNQSIIAALPERLLCTLATQALVKKRPSADTDIFKLQPESKGSELTRALAAIDRDCDFVSYKPANTNVQQVLLGHPCTPVGDWIGLLADIGRGWRASAALGVELESLVAGTAWMRDNRSFSQFANKSISINEIENGLCLNLVRRQRLYAALGIRANIKDVSAYGYGGNLPKQKLENIAEFYTSLSQIIYGTNSTILTPEKREAISKKELNADSTTLAWEARTLSKAGLFNTGENRDLEIIGRIAKQFSRTDQQTFQYFLAQWFAQQPYRQTALKCAVFSERPFDRLLDDLSGYINERWWSNSTNNATNQTKPLPPLAAAYFPHYRIGKLQLLPYNPLSLDALRMKFDDHTQIEQRICSLEGPINRDALILILTQTPLLDRNRLLADVASFLTICSRRVPETVTDACQRAGLCGLRDLLGSFSPATAMAWERERTALTEIDLSNQWNMWLQSITNGSQVVPQPLHIAFLLHESWDAENLLKATQIFLVAREIYQILTWRS